MNWSDRNIKLTDASLRIGNDLVMFTSETPVMHAMVDKLISNPGSVLEIGYGMGISSKALLSKNPTSYSLIEWNKQIMKTAKQAINIPNATFIQDDWRNCLDVGTFDYIFFDTFDTENQGGTFYVEFLKLCHNFMHSNSVLAAVVTNDHFDSIKTKLPFFFKRFDLHFQEDTNGITTIFPICSGAKDPLLENRKKCQTY